MPVYALSDALLFPPPAQADPEGLLGVGGDLSPERLLLAYRSGIFPWFSEGDPILWWSPDPRFVLFPAKLKVSKSMRQTLRSPHWRVTIDTAFAEVVRACRKAPRPDQDGTWITPSMVDAYVALHAAGHAHSVEVWRDDALVGGLYGVAIGGCFCGESMFARVSNASKVGFTYLVRALEERGYSMVDCQMHTPHLESLGAEEIDREDFLALLGMARKAKVDFPQSLADA